MWLMGGESGEAFMNVYTASTHFKQKNDDMIFLAAIDQMFVSYMHFRFIILGDLKMVKNK